jgi:hypothetical protein
VIVSVPDLIEVYSTEHDATPGVSVGASSHVDGTKCPLALLLVQLTVPVGAVIIPAVVSLTVAVQVVVPPAANELGLQATLVAVARFVTVTLNVPELVSCVASLS